jgi:hypothetical protein
MSDSSCSEFRSTHIAHLLCKELFECCSEVVMVLSKMASCWFSQVSVFARSRTGSVVFLLWFCKDLCFCLEGVRIPPPYITCYDGHYPIVLANETFLRPPAA